jgi:hypothetical protein
MKTQAAALDAFLGVWRIIPAESRYELGSPPREAVYEIDRDGEWLLFSGRWTAADGRRLEMSFAGVPDGEPHAYDDPAVADTLTTTLVDARTLDTTVTKDGRMTAVGRRVLSEDGATLTVTQSGTTPDGRPFANVSVYARV